MPYQNRKLLSFASLATVSLTTMIVLTGCFPSDSSSDDSDDDAQTDGDITYKTFTNTIADCEAHTGSFYSEDVYDINNSTTFDGSVTVSSANDSCSLMSNGIPNHDFNDSSDRAFSHDVVQTNYALEWTRNPAIAGEITELRNGEDEGIMLNGVPIAVLTSTCWDDACEWRENPFYGTKARSIDSNDAHSNSSGEYHYHGNPVDLYDNTGATVSAVIGYAADGFPIYGPYILDSITQQIREVESSYKLKEGTRQSGEPDEGDAYTGEWREDYEYVEALGDLDECNGMEVDGAYAYYVSSTFPYLMACFKGTPDDSFSTRGLSARSHSHGHGDHGEDEHVHPH